MLGRWNRSLGFEFFGDFVGRIQQFAPLCWLQCDSFLAGQHFAVFFVEFTNVNECFAFERSNTDTLRLLQYPVFVAIFVHRRRFGCVRSFCLLGRCTLKWPTKMCWQKLNISICWRWQYNSSILTSSGPESLSDDDDDGAFFFFGIFVFVDLQQIDSQQPETYSQVMNYGGAAVGMRMTWIIYFVSAR